MKKLISIAVLAVIMVALVASNVNAVTSETLAGDLYSLLSEYGMSSADRVRVEKYLNDNEISDEQATEALAQAQAAVEIMEVAGVTNVAELTPELKSQVTSRAQQAASAVGLKLTTTNGNVKVTTEDGTTVYEGKVSEDGKLVYTGNNVNVIAVISSVAVLALATAVVARKRIANA